MKKREHLATGPIQPASAKRHDFAGHKLKQGLLWTQVCTEAKVGMKKEQVPLPRPPLLNKCYTLEQSRKERLRAHRVCTKARLSNCKDGSDELESKETCNGCRGKFIGNTGTAGTHPCSHSSWSIKRLSEAKSANMLSTNTSSSSLCFITPSKNAVKAEAAANQND